MRSQEPLLPVNLKERQKNQPVTWKMYDEVTDIFLALVNRQELDEYNISIIQQFVCILYERTSPYFWVNDARKQMFALGQTSFENIPPSEAGLEQHVMRTMMRTMMGPVPGFISGASAWFIAQ